MPMNLDQLARQVASAIETYGVPDPHREQLGSPLPPEWFEAGLAAMRCALIPPYLVEVKDFDTEPGRTLSRNVVVVADDAVETLLAFDPNPAGDFVLVWRRPDQLALSNIRGDAVGCFLSR
jgi:hypothetical protein